MRSLLRVWCWIVWHKPKWRGFRHSGGTMTITMHDGETTVLPIPPGRREWTECERCGKILMAAKERPDA